MKKTKSIAINTILNSIRMTLTIIVPLITYPYITRIFSAEGVGQYEWVKSVVSVFMLIASMGITTYAVREGSKIRDDRVKFTKFAQELFILNLISTLICYIVLAGLIFTVPQFGNYTTYLIIYSVNIGLSALSLDWVYGVYEDYAYITKRQIIVQLVSVLGLFIFVKDSNDLILYIIIITISNSGSNIFNFIHAKKYVDFRKIKKYNLVVHLSPVIVLFGARFAMNAYNSLDTILLGFMTTDAQVGYYNVAVKINTILVTFFIAMSPVYLPRMIKYIQENKKENQEALLKKIVSLKTILIFPMIVGLFCFSSQIIWIIAGEGFESASFTLKILSFVLLFVILSSIIQKDVLVPLGQEKMVLSLTIIAAVLNVGLSAILIMTIGYNGAAYGSLVAESIVFFLGAKYLMKYKINIFKIIIVSSYKYIFSAILMSILCYILSTSLVDNVLILCIGVPVCAIFYLCALLIYRDNFMISVIKSLMSRFKNKLGGS